ARIRTGNACGGRRAPAGLRHRADLSGPYPRQNYGARAGRPHADGGIGYRSVFGSSADGTATLPPRPYAR
ncbi:MAG: hypothetical protein JWM15_552, partial [Cryptosporangiaceae bacterium]|nr:hypothetical protein [Cryptosporangiaceae bacterium]